MGILAHQTAGNLKKIRLLAFLLFALTVWMVKEPLSKHYGFYIAIGDCLPHKVYFFNKKQTIGNLKKGDIVAGYAIHMEPELPDGETIVKMVAGVAGDIVEIQNGIVKINGRYLDTVFYGVKKEGVPKTHWDTTYTINEGELFLYGTGEKSYDSRYWGVFPKSRIIGVVRPIF